MKTTIKKKVAIVGAGIAGLSCATHLQALGFEVGVFEKSRGPSGRMSTKHGEGWTADHGAQYFTARDPLFKHELDSWIENGIVDRWKDCCFSLLKWATIFFPENTTKKEKLRTHYLKWCHRISPIYFYCSNRY